MSYDDKKFSTLFPTRTGGATGTANERKMLDAIGGSDSFRKKFQTNNDGSVTQCNTRNGMPEFITTRAPSQSGSVQPYMESGQLGWAYAPAESPLLGDPAKWYFLDIPPGSEWLGKIVGKPPSPGAQANSPSLSEAMDSLAVGYPRKADPAADAASKAAYLSTTAMKKLVIGFFPPSLFSGKMRLFMQALYGAKAAVASALSTDGASVVYTANGASVVLDHNTTGIFSASDSTWWVLQISTVGGTGGYVVTGWQVKPNLVGKALLKIYKSGVVSGLDKTKLEAYIFAHSTIDTANPKSVGAYAGAQGSALSYGWKWNKDGSKASIVVHEVLGTGVADLRWFSSTMHLTFAYDAGNLSVMGETVSNGEWIDGWGSYNIFVPENEMSSAPLVCKSLRFNFGAYKTPLLFSGVPVYGYYVDDVWTPVTLTSTGNVPGPTYQYNSANVYQDPAVTPSDGPNHFDYFYMWGGESCMISIRSLTNSTGMSVSFGGASVEGRSASVTLIKTEGLLLGSPFINPATITAGYEGGMTIADQGSYSTALWHMHLTVKPGKGWDAAHAWTYGEGGAGQVGLADVRAPYRRLESTIYGTDNKLWALIIPGLDAESLYITQYSYIATASGGTYDKYHSSQGHGQSPIGFTNTPDTEDDLYLGWWNITSGIYYIPWGNIAHSGNAWETETYSAASGLIEEETNVLCFNNTVSGVAGTPGGSYYALYNCSKYYPYYDRGMWMLTSAGQRYIGSELPASPSSVEKRSFVGWA